MQRDSFFDALLINPHITNMLPLSTPVTVAAVLVFLVFIVVFCRSISAGVAQAQQQQQQQHIHSTTSMIDSQQRRRQQQTTTLSHQI